MDNAQIARGVFEEIFSQGKLERIDQYFDRGYRGHDTLTGEVDRDRFRQSVQMYRSAFPDLNCKVDDIVAASEKVLVRWSAQGTHRGQFLGKGPTNKKTQVEGITVFTFRGGKIVEDYTQWDALSLLQELGITPQIPELSAQPAT